MKRTPIFFPLRLKFIIFCFILITIPLTIIGFLIYVQYMNQVENDANQYTGQLANQIVNSMDRYYQDMDRLTTIPYYDPEVMSILALHSSPELPGFVHLEEIRRMSLMISSLSSGRSEIQNILIFTMDGTLFTNTDDSVNKTWEPNLAPWMQEVVAADGGIVAIPPHSAGYYKSGDSTVISLARVIRDPQTHRHLGAIKIDLNRRGFASIFGADELRSDIVIHISDKYGQVLFASGDQQSRNVQSEPLFLTAESTSPLSAISVKVLVPEAELKKNARALVRYTLLVSAAALLFAYLFAGIFASRLTQPIRRLSSLMKKVQRGDFRERAKVTTRDEIGLLTEGFNTMVTELDRLVHQIYEIRILEKEAQLTALESQINPHFIYNTLESINVKALERGNNELSEIIVSLGKLLRYTVDKRERFVRLEDELQFAEAYLQIQAFRLGDMLAMEILCDLSLVSCLMPKLLLQPLVENAVEHGFYGGPLTIRIRVCSEEEDLFLYVEDNGAGISDSKLHELDQLLYGQEKPQAGIGSFGARKKGFALRNVNKRIQLLFGPPYGLYIDRTVQIGTTFYLRIPLRWEYET